MIVDAVLDVMRPFLAARKTLVDVGAGDGRRAAVLAAELDWVTVVEPSDELCAGIPDVPNMTVIASTWEDAEVQPADLVLCAGVLPSVDDVAAFVRKLEAAATERVFVTVAGDVEALLAGLGVAHELAGGGRVAHWRPGART